MLKFLNFLFIFKLPNHFFKILTTVGRLSPVKSPVLDAIFSGKLQTDIIELGVSGTSELLLLWWVALVDTNVE
jgi:hypothetical protein